MANLEGLVDELFRSVWSRLYLDTAEFHNIGRGHTPPAVVDRLLAACERHAIVLVVSFAHMRDALKPGDKDAGDLLASTLERFWMRGLVIRGPDDIEPWTAGPADIEISGWGNVREFLGVTAAKPSLEEHHTAQHAMFFADVAAKSAQRSAIETGSTKKLSKDHEAIVVGASQSLMLGMQTDAGAAVDWAARVIDCQLSEAESFDLFKRVMPAEMAVLMLKEYIDAMDPTIRARMWSIIKAGPELAPGAWLAKQLAGNRYRNIQRGASLSDCIDLEHATHYPYVDIATCDRQAYAAIVPHLATARGTRPVKLFKNGELEAIINHIETLPTHDAIRDEAIQRRIQSRQ